uniref:Uncharacterized protein n=1 Tax=Ascaris lumbricoides TaxID=6252 RepID=A0A0M3HR59_ASCLU
MRQHELRDMIRAGVATLIRPENKKCSSREKQQRKWLGGKENLKWVERSQGGVRQTPRQRRYPSLLVCSNSVPVESSDHLDENVGARGNALT